MNSTLWRLYRICMLVLSVLLSFEWNAHADTQMIAQKPQKLFLAIGVDRYQDGRWPKLRYSGKDALDVATALRDSFDGGSVLSDSNRQEPIKRDEVLTAFQHLAAQNRNEDDTIIVYLSTHGTLAQNTVDGRRTISKYLVMGDTKYDEITSTGLSIPELLERFKALKSRRKALIIDACYAGQGKAHITPAMLEFLAKQKAGVLQPPVESIDESTAVYSAAAWGEEALEDPNLKNGVYTHFLLKAFREDLNGDGAVQLSEAHTEATTQVIEFTKGAQHPSAQVEIVGQDPVILQGNPQKSGRPMLLAWRRDLRNYLVSFNGKSLGNLKKGALSLPEGKGRLEIYDAESKRLVRTARVDLEANETYLLESFLAEDRPHILRAGYGWSWFGSAHARKRISPKTLPFSSFSYQYQDAFAGAALALQASYYAPQSGAVEVDARRLGQPIGLQDAGQTVQGYRLDLKLVRDARIAWLTDYNRRWQTSWQSAVGASYLSLDRNLPEWGLRDHSSSVGLTVEQGLEVYWNFRHLSWQLATQFSIFDDQWLQSGSPVGMWSLASGFGLAF
jgi:uncharacterized caspase-like protein